ncbi:MAG: hypothetical protein DRP85_00915 [Candidatus Makaraimicrobium thalassicum]|nr:MAG: hypothetical protein DRP85_00915 [Candidatus Omnitrophota bacterium]
MKILLIGSYYKNQFHGAEVGIYNALKKLEHKVDILDLQATQGKFGDSIVYNQNLNELAEHAGKYDFILVVGAGINPDRLTDKVKSLLANHVTVVWNSEPIRLNNYRDRLLLQKHYYNFFFTFDEGEIPLYLKNEMRPCYFLPQAFNPDWYRPIDIENKEFICFVGSVGGKWVNRHFLLQRIKKITRIYTTMTFNAEHVNKIYNMHWCGINLGLYHEELGPPPYLSSYGYQQRIFELIGAGCIPITNLPADFDRTPEQRRMFTNKKNIIFYTNDSLEAILKYYRDNQDKLQEIRESVLQIRENHTYEARMKTMVKLLEKGRFSHVQ